MTTKLYAQLLIRYRELTGEDCGTPASPVRTDTPPRDRAFWLDVEREFGHIITSELEEWLA